MHHVDVAVDASSLGDAAVARLDLNWFVKVFQREGKRVKKTIICFGHPFASKGVRKVTIVAHRDVVVAGVLPRVKVILHHVAIRACVGVVAEITGPLAIAEREGADACQNSDGDDQHQRGNPLAAAQPVGR